MRGGRVQFSLISWSAEVNAGVALSTAEAEGQGTPMKLTIGKGVGQMRMDNKVVHLLTLSCVIRV